MPTLRQTKNAIRRHEAKHGRNLEMRRAFNLIGGKQVKIGLNRVGNPKQLLFVGSFAGAHKWLKNPKPMDCSKWEKAELKEIEKICFDSGSRLEKQCDKLLDALRDDLRICAVRSVLKGGFRAMKKHILKVEEVHGRRRNDLRRETNRLIMQPNL